MKDMLLIVDDKNEWGVDIDVKDGEPVLVPQEPMSDDQRAALCAYIGKGTIPGALDIGVDFTTLYAGEKSLVEVDNQVRQMIEQWAKPDGEHDVATSEYNPVYYKEANDSPLAVRVLKAEIQ